MASGSNTPSTSGTSSPAQTCGKRESLTCAVCLEVYSDPKILPCFHTFCLKCLNSLPQVAHGWEQILSCPKCRAVITVPAGGVVTFKTDFRIDAEELEKARNGLYCQQHPSKEMDLYCDDCKVPACTKCMLLSHKGHEMLDMAEVAAKKQLQDDRRRLKRVASELQSNMDEFEKDQKEVLKKKRVLEDMVHEKHAALYAAADNVRDETLAYLSSVTDFIIENHNDELQKQQDTLQQVRNLEGRVQQALAGKAGSEQVVSVAREMKTGSGSDSSLKNLTAQHTTAVPRPVLRRTASPNALLQQMRDYMGSAVQMEMPADSQPKVVVVEQFRCRQNPDTNIFCVCPLDDTTVLVSYRSRNSLDELPAEEYVIRRKEICHKEENVKGCVTYFNKGVFRGNRVVLPHVHGSALRPVYSKSATVFKLLSDASGTFTVTKEERVGERQTLSECRSTRVFTSYKRVHSVRSFDASSDEQLFAVVQEEATYVRGRMVEVYQYYHFGRSYLYTSPVQPFLPSDVCFFTLGGQEVLLVADELNDAIHVVDVQNGQLSFSHFLAPGCPLLVQPTTLNTDDRGRLWVACRGGRILTCSE